MHKTRIKFLWMGLVHTVVTQATADKMADHASVNAIIARLLQDGATIISVRPLVKR